MVFAWNSFPSFSTCGKVKSRVRCVAEQNQSRWQQTLGSIPQHPRRTPHMSLSLFTIIQAQDSMLARAVQGLEQMTGSTQPSVMRNTQTITQSHSQSHSRSRTHSRSHSQSNRTQHFDAHSDESKETQPPHPQSSPSSSPSLSNTTSVPPSSITRQHNLPVRLIRPHTPRRSTDPEYPLNSSPAVYAHSIVHATAAPASTASLSSISRPRNKSPYNRSHSRSYSANNVNSSAMSQPMMRAQSLPARTSSPNSLSPAIGGTSPMLRSSPRSTSPFRPSSPHDSQSSHSPSFYDGGFETISEHAELDLSQSSFDRNINSLNSSRTVGSRRPRQVSPSRSPLSSSASSPSLSAQKFNEGFPTLHHYSSTSSFSSISSTPSTTRSRSPSISSLGTIEDAPDAEFEAIQAERIAKLKFDAEAEERGESEVDQPRRTNSLDIPHRPVGFGFTRGGSARKRWSVCGAERRADLDLETIWED